MNSSPMFHRGEIRVADLETGHSFDGEVGKVRPVILLGDDHDGAIIVPMTTKQRAERGSTRIWVPQTEANGLDQDGVAIAHHVRAIDTQRLGKRIGQLDTVMLDLVVAAVARSIGLAT